MVDPRQQFRVLYRDFLVRLIDLELLSAGGDVTKLYVQFAALLGAFNLVLAIFLVPAYALSNLPPDKLALGATGDQEFLIATTMVIVGMFAVLAWDAVFPDRHDIAILGTLPVRTRTLFKAKIAAIATGLGISVVAVNIATGLSYPFALPAVGGVFSDLRTLSAYWITMAAAGGFIFSALLALQGMAALLFSYRLFLRISNFLQITVFFLILGGYFLTPSSSELSVTAQESQKLVARFPSYWFLGLFQVLNGPVHPVFRALAMRAWWSLGVTTTLAVITYSFGYFRNIRRIIEQPDILPADRSAAASRNVIAVLAKGMIPKPLERAIFLFTARTLARSRQHRTILAVYGGIGLAISLAYAKIFLYANSRMYAPTRAYIRVPRWYEPNIPFLAAGFVILFLLIIGTRAVFSLPATLKANWIFRITAVHSPRAYFAAVRKALYGFAAVPVWIAGAVLYFSIWPPRPVMAHLMVLTLAGIILVERSLYEFRKVPFVCSYLPGKTDLKRKLAIYGTLFLLVTDVGTRVEYWTMQSGSRYVVLIAILLTLAWRARSRWVEFSVAPYERLQFLDLETPEVSPLDLRRDGAWGTERYLDAVDPEPERPWATRIKTASIRTAMGTVALCAVGAIYEQYGQWRHRREFPQIGRPVNIGGRSLNIFCSGADGPTVVFESGAGGPGYAWVLVQREVARFTRACWYDRAGYGWSDSGPYPRDSAAAAGDLHQLLHQAGIAPPYVLVGASLGGLHVRVFNWIFPEDVAGLVLVDSSHVDESELIVDPPLMRVQPVLAQVLRQVGILRVIMDSGPGPPPRGITSQEWRIANSFEPRTLAENAKEQFSRSLREARAAGSVGDKPLVVLTAGLPSGQAANPVEARAALAGQKHWIEIQRQLARLSPRGRQVIVQDSRHGIQFDAPEAVIAAVREVVMEARAAH